MDEEKKKKLTDSGWTIGNAEDFLNLSKPEIAVIEIRERLIKGLKERRFRIDDIYKSKMNIEELIKYAITTGASINDIAQMMSP